MQWNILNYGQITNNVRVQDARFQELLVDYQNTVLRRSRRSRTPSAMYVQSRRQAVFLQESEVAAEGALTIAMNQYSEGTADFTTC